MWNQGDIDSLVRKGRVLQRHLNVGAKRRADSSEHLASTFSRLMLAGKTRAALHLLSEAGRGEVLSLDQFVDPSSDSPLSVLDALRKKHPPPAAVSSEA